MSDKFQHKMTQQDRVAVLAIIMEGPVGREWMWDLLADCQIFNSTIGPHHEMCAREGKRAVGLRYYKDIQSADKLKVFYGLMQKEATQRQEELRNARNDGK